MWNSDYLLGEMPGEEETAEEVTFLEDALEIEPGNHKNYRVAAGVLLLIDDVDGAKSAIEKAIELAPAVSEYQDMHTFIVNYQRGN